MTRIKCSLQPEIPRVGSTPSKLWPVTNPIGIFKISQGIEKWDVDVFCEKAADSIQRNCCTTDYHDTYFYCYGTAFHGGYYTEEMILYFYELKLNES